MKKESREKKQKNIYVSELDFNILKELKKSNYASYYSLNKELNASFATFHETTQKLIDYGLVDRHPTEDDHRRVSLTITNKGKQFLEIMI